MNEDTIALMELLTEEDWGVWKSCPFCDRQFPNYSALLAHMRKDHKERMG